jgi:hypothetical protein
MSLSVHLNHSSQLDEVIAALPQESGRLAVQTQGSGDASAAKQDTMITSLSNIDTNTTGLNSCVSGSEMQVDVVTLPSIPAGSNTIGSVASIESRGSDGFAGSWTAGSSTTGVSMDGYRIFSFSVHLSAGTEFLTLEGSSDSGTTWSPVSDYYASTTTDSTPAVAYSIHGVVSNSAHGMIRLSNYTGSAISVDSQGCVYTRQN